LISQGADIVTNHTGSAAAVQASEEKGVWSLSYNSDMAKYGPKTCLTGVIMVWDQYYIDRANALVEGSWKAGDIWGGVGDIWGGVKDGMITLAPFNRAIPDPVVQEIAAKRAAIAAGTFKPFSGPITDQSGKLRIAEGASLQDKDILEMKWFVEGVQGKL
jgi:basic membrane protein A